MSSLRVVRWQVKLVYVIAAWCVGWVVSWSLYSMGLPGAVVSVLNGMVSLASVLLGARIFRGRGEDLTPRRPWWQMTARPLLSRILSVLFLVVAVQFAVVLVLAGVGVAYAIRSVERLTLADTIVDGTIAAVLAFFYLTSSIRLPKAPSLDRAPKFKPFRLMSRAHFLPTTVDERHDHFDH